MGLELYDGRRKHLDRLSSAGAAYELLQVLKKQPDRWPLFLEFLTTGEQLVTPAFLEELQRFISVKKAKSSTLVRSITEDLLDTLNRHKPKRVWIGM